MKKIVLLLVLILNIVPTIKEFKIQFVGQLISAQGYSLETINGECYEVDYYNNISLVSSTPCDALEETAHGCICGSCKRDILCSDVCGCCPICGNLNCTCPNCHKPGCFGQCQNSDLPEDDDNGLIPPGGSAGSGGGGGEGSSGGSSQTKDCNGVLNGTAYYDNCGTCVEGNTYKKPCDCMGIPGGTAHTNSCGECVGGSSGKEDCSPCIPINFNYVMNVAPISMNQKYEGYGWCGFLTLATIKGGDPCYYASKYFAQYLPQLHIVGCNSKEGILPGLSLRSFYMQNGIGFGGIVSYSCDLINSISPNKAILFVPDGHVYVVYGFHRNNSGEITVDKYDTNDASGWNRTSIPLEDIILTESHNVIYK